MPKKKTSKPKPASTKKPKKKAPPRPTTKAAADDASMTAPPARKSGQGGKRRSKTTSEPTAKTAKAPATKPAKGSTVKGKGHGKCSADKCSSGTCPARKQLDGRSLYDRARECKDLEECRKFIVEFNEAIEQANQWLDDMHGQALSAEQARDLYGEQISDLLEAIELDRARVTELEAELKKARSTSPRSAAADAVLDKLAELGKEVRSIRTDLRRLLDGRGPSTERRQRSRAAERAPEGRRRGRPPKAAADAATSSSPGGEANGALVGPGSVRAAKTARRNGAPGAFPKYSVLRGAACSLGVGKYGYPPEVCAPASFPREEAAQILGTYAQNKYGGLAKWALITGLPIDDVVVPLPAQQAPARKAAPSSTPRQRASSKAPRAKAPKPPAAERSNKQILDQVLLTVARV